MSDAEAIAIFLLLKFDTQMAIYKILSLCFPLFATKPLFSLLNL